MSLQQGSRQCAPLGGLDRPRVRSATRMGLPLMRRALAAPAPATAGLTTAPLLLLVLLGLLAVRLIALALNGTDLFFDEAQYWTWAQVPAFGYYSKPPLIAALIGATTEICGDGAFCVRLAAPILHTITAGLVFLVGRRLYDDLVGLWASVTFATLPGVSFSSGIISTDVPLLTAWALALLGLVGLVQDRDRWAPALALGLGLGLGLNAKYAMAFFPASLAIWLIATPSARWLLRDRRLWVALAIGLLLIAPNLAWNTANKFATFAHTADNARWSGSLLNVGKGLEFVAAQLGVFGPILAAGLVVVMRRAWREGLAPPDRMLLCLALPVLLAITGQAFVSRAHANWAAVAYVAGSILVPATFLRLGLDRWLRGSLALHAAILGLIVLGTSLAGRFTLPIVGDPFQRTLGWAAIASRTEAVLAEARAAGRPFAAVVTDERALTASLLYYMRNEPTPVRAVQLGPRPLDHYEMTRRLHPATEGPVLLVAIRGNQDTLLAAFPVARPIRIEEIAAGLGSPRRIRFIALEPAAAR